MSAEIATAHSVPDMVWKEHDTVVGIHEIKGNNSSPMSGLRQAAVYGTNVAMNLISLGIKREDCLVPISVDTDMYAQFGAIYLLEPSYPVFVVISEGFDLKIESQAARASSYMLLTARYLREAYGGVLSLLHAPVGATEKADVAMKLNTNSYYIKVFTQVVMSRGLGMFAHISNASDISLGLEHMGSALNRLFLSEAAAYVAFPLAVMSPLGYGDCYSIIYNDLCKDGYRIGTPNRIDREDVYTKYVVALERAIDLVHATGVIHCDLYASNIMWVHREDEDTVDIKIIDWDCAHTLEEGRFYPAIADALHVHTPTRGTIFDWIMI